MRKFARGWSVAGIAIAMLGATALSGPAFAQDRGGFDLLRHFAQNVATPDHHGGGGGGGGGGGSGGKTLDPGPRGGTAGAGGPLPGLSQDGLNFFTAATDVVNQVAAVTPAGFGPRFNLDSCGGCHVQPAAGGSGPPTNPPRAGC